MKPSRTDEDALVDLLDVLLRDGVVVEADVIVSVADIPLIGVKLRAAVAGMKTMTDYGMFESFDRGHRARAMEGDVMREPVSRVDAEVPDGGGAEIPASTGGDADRHAAPERGDDGGGAS